MEMESGARFLEFSILSRRFVENIHVLVSLQVYQLTWERIFNYHFMNVSSYLGMIFISNLFTIENG